MRAICVVDDFIPVKGGNTSLYMRQSASNEFWAVLLEKAYAKLYGSYQQIDGGLTSDSMEDFTGGLSELYDNKVNLSGQRVERNLL